MATVLPASAAPGWTPDAHVQVAAAPPPTGSPSAAAVALAARVLSGDTDDATAAVSEAFARAGVATRTVTAEAVTAVAPTLPIYLLTTEARSLALDQSSRANGGAGRFTLDDLGTVLQGLGHPVAPGQTAGKSLALVLSAAVKAARVDPDNPHSFTPLFLQAVTHAENPAIDLSTGSTDPATIELSLLESELILLAHLRANASYPPQYYLTPGPSASALQFGPMQPYGQTGQQNTPCSDFENGLNLPALTSLHKISLDKTTSVPFNKLWTALGIAEDTVAGEASRFALSKSLAVLKLISSTSSVLNDNINFTLNVDPDTQYYTLLDATGTPQDGVRNQAVFTATVTASPGNLNDPTYHATADCLNTLGFAAPDDFSTQVANWKVFWYAEGLGKHASYGLQDNAFDVFQPVPGNKLAVTGSTGAAALVVDMATEQDPPLNSVEVSAPARVRGELDQSQPPDFVALLIKSLIDVPDAVFDLTQAWYTKATPRKASATLTAIYFAPVAGWKGTISYDHVIQLQRDEQRSGPDSYGGTWTSSDSEVHDIHDTATFIVNGPVVSVSMQSIARTSTRATTSGTDFCGFNRNPTTRPASSLSTQMMVAQGSGGFSGDSVDVSISVDPNGSYNIRFVSPEITTTLTSDSHSEATGCDEQPPKNDHFSYETNGGPFRGDIKARVDPAHPDHLAGSTIETLPPDSPDPDPAVKTSNRNSTTITWDLTRGT